MSVPSQINSTQTYIGRFAPSPTGPLHLGSLITAFASYIDAKANKGLWLVRIEDLDPPREPPKAADEILIQLKHFGLEWDGKVLYQSTRSTFYQEALSLLIERGLCFKCDCTRPRVKAMGSVYDGSCRERSVSSENEFAIRLKTESIEIGFKDLIQGNFQQNIRKEVGDFIILRKDKLFAYQLAVVVDDAFQGITNIIRGVDLLDSTPRQIYQQRVLGYAAPQYGHIPIVVNKQGLKLSKQNFAEPVNTHNSSELVHLLLQLLGQSPPNNNQSKEPRFQLQWAIENWDIQAVPKLANISQDTQE
mgnify:FL=1